MKKINRQYIFIILQQSNKIAFGSSQERDFSQSIFSGRQQIIKTFIIKQILWKLMSNFFFKFKRALFLAIFLVHFPINLAKKVFPKQLAVIHNFINVSSTVTKFKNYFITVSMQKISSIHALIQQSLESHQLNNHAHSWPHPPKNQWAKVNFRVPLPNWPHLFLTMSIQKYLVNILIYVNLYEHAKNQSISLI